MQKNSKATIEMLQFNTRIGEHVIRGKNGFRGRFPEKWVFNLYVMKMYQNRGIGEYSISENHSPNSMLDSIFMLNIKNYHL